MLNSSGTHLLIGSRVRNQRKHLYSEGKPSCTTADRIRELEIVEFVWDPLADSWSVRFRELCEFKAQFGPCLLQFGYSSDPKLGRWVANQRHDNKLYSEGKQRHITPQRMRELESVEFVQDPLADVWNLRFRHLRDFRSTSANALCHSGLPTQNSEGALRISANTCIRKESQVA